MSSINNFTKLVTVSAFVFLAAAAASGAILLEDDFTDPEESHMKWMKSSDNMTVTVDGGSCALSNMGQGIGEYLHTFAAPKPSTFTISYTLKSQTGGGNNSGVLFCKQPDTYNGYFLTVDGGDTLAVYKMVQSETSIGGDRIYYKKSFDINPSNNEISVSKIGSRIVFFANGRYVGEFTDNSYDSGDLALFLFSNATAVFGPVRVTNEFTNGEPSTYFSDSFDNGRSKYWKYLNSGGNPEISDAGGVLSVTTVANVWSWNYVDVALTDFEARVEVRHVDGGVTSNDLYGILLLGDAPPNEPIPMLHFGITGNRGYSIWSPRDGDIIPVPVQNSAIRGSAGAAAVVYIDTLVVKKKAGAAVYEFIVNGQPISVDYGIVNFPITGAGIFSSGGMVVAYDNFEAKREGAVSIKFSRNTQRTLRGGNKAAKSANNVFYDLRGRKRYTVNSQTSGRMQMRSAGMYINENGREVSVRKNRR